MANHQLLVDHILRSEGGCSSDPEDNALKYGHSGVLGKGYDNRHPNNYVHTCKGVIWSTYVAYCKIKKKTPNAQEFLKMSPALWGDIYKTLFWDKVRGDEIKSQAIAEILVEAVWGGGLQGMVREMQRWLNTKGASLEVDGAIGKLTIAALNKYTKTAASQKELFDTLTAQRLRYLKSLGDWWKYGNGWTDRVSKLAARAESFFGKTSTKVGGSAILLVLGGYLAYNYLRKKKIKIIA
jgi:lysozyme family protein